MQKKSLILLSLIILVGFLLRFYNVWSNPPSLYWDEVSQGNNAYSILKTGRDEHKILFQVLPGPRVVFARQVVGGRLANERLAAAGRAV